MLIKENRLRSIIRSIIKEAIGPKGPRPAIYDQMGFPEDTEIEPDDRSIMPRNLPVSSVTSWDDEEEQDSDYYEPEEEDPYGEYEMEDSLEGESALYNMDDNATGQAAWEAQNPGLEPEQGDICNDGMHEYMCASDCEWIKNGRVNSRGRRRGF